MDSAKGCFRVQSDKLDCSKDELAQHLKITCSDGRNRESLAGIKGLVKPAKPGYDFDMIEPKQKEVSEVIRKARAGLAPGLNGIGY